MMFLRCAAICLSALLAALVARSAVLHNYPQKLVQPDGSVVHCYASGDEFHHWLHDAQSYTIVQDSTTGYFVYGVLQNGALSPTTHIVGKVNPEAAGLTPGANIPAAAKQAMRDNALARTGMGWKEASSVGAISNIVIFVRFADEPTTAFPDWIAEFDRMFNSPLPGANSMYNYYREVSYNRLSILSTFYPSAIDSVVSYTDTHPRNYYKKFNAVTNPAGYTTGDEAWAREQTMLASAIRAVSSQVPAGLNIDANNDGFVDNVCFVVSGGVEAWADLLWPHMSSLTYLTAAINGKTVGVYNFQLRNALLDPGNMVYVLAHDVPFARSSGPLSLQFPTSGSRGCVGYHELHRQPASPYERLHEMEVRRLDQLDSNHHHPGDLCTGSPPLADEQLLQDSFHLFVGRVLRSGISQADGDIREYSPG